MIVVHTDDVRHHDNESQATPPQAAASKPKRDREALEGQPPSKRAKQVDPPERTIKQEPLEGEIAPLASEAAIKLEEDDLENSMILQPTVPADVTVSETIEAFLRDIPLPLMPLAPRFAHLGISTFTHLQSLACLSSNIRAELFADLKQRGFKSVEINVLDSAFEYVLRHDSTSLAILALAHDSIVVNAADTIDSFLSGLRPSLAHHVQTFADLGITVPYLPHVKGLSPSVYRALERGLESLGFSWAELFILKSAVHRVVLT